MTAKSLIASFSLLLATSAAFAAAPAADDPSTGNGGGLTRAQVIAETVAARKAGLLDQNEATMDLAARSTAPSTLTRAQVIADTLAARAAGELDRNGYEDGGYVAPRAKAAKVDAQLAAKSEKATAQ